jgi:sporulation protein YtfJ
VRAGERTLIPVSKTYLAGGFGFGQGGRERNPGDGEGEDGGGGGGLVISRPVGFIDSGPEGTRFQPIADHDRARARALAGAAAAGALAGAALAGTALAGTAVSAIAARRVARAVRPAARTAAQFAGGRVRRRRWPGQPRRFRPRWR